MIANDAATQDDADIDGFLQQHHDDAQAKFQLQMADYAGPLDLLLDLCRRNKFDLSKISVAELARQYIHFIETAQKLKIEIAADYLWMATYLAWLKSRLLVPSDDEDDEEEALSPTEQADRLRLRLLYLDKIKSHADALMARPHLGRDFFKKGKSEYIGVSIQGKYDTKLYQLLQSYAHITIRNQTGTFEIIPTRLFSAEQMQERLHLMLDVMVDWKDIQEFMPTCSQDLMKKSAFSGLVVASLALVKLGKVDIQQSMPFAPIYIKAVTDETVQS